MRGRRCELCPALLAPGAHACRRFCPRCAARRHVERNTARRKAERPAAASAFITAGNAFHRAVADATLARGHTRRRCSACYTLYPMQGLETPCPHCGGHLRDVPPTCEVTAADLAYNASQPRGR